MQFPQIYERVNIFNFADSVVAEVELLELGQLVEALNLLDLVGGQEDLLEAGEVVEGARRDLLDDVEGQVEEHEVLEVAQILKLRNFIVVKLQLDQIVARLEALDFLDEVLTQHQPLNKSQNVLTYLQVLGLLQALNLGDAILHAKVDAFVIAGDLEALLAHVGVGDGWPVRVVHHDVLDPLTLVVEDFPDALDHLLLGLLLVRGRQLDVHSEPLLGPGGSCLRRIHMNIL